MKSIIRVIFCFFLIISCKPETTIKKPNFLKGKWQRVNEKPDKQTFDFWNDDLTGIGFTLKENDTIFKEVMSIVSLKDTLYLKVEGVNETPTLFKFTQQTDSSFISENKENEFPKKIHYLKDGEQLKCKISNEEFEVDFVFEKIKSVNSSMKKNNSNIVLDTLNFDDSNENLLSKKYAYGFSKLNFYKQFILKDKINRKQILNEESSKTEIRYLGKIMDLDTNDFYHIITSFKIIGIGKIESPRGISNVAFLNDALDKIIIYKMSLPNELPEKIEDNILYFKLDSKKIGVLISGGLSPMLCIPIIGCN